MVLLALNELQRPLLAKKTSATNGELDRNARYYNAGWSYSRVNGGTHWKTVGPKTVARLKAVMRFSLWLDSTSVRKRQR